MIGVFDVVEIECWVVVLVMNWWVVDWGFEVLVVYFEIKGDVVGDWVIECMLEVVFDLVVDVVECLFELGDVGVVFCVVEVFI